MRYYKQLDTVNNVATPGTAVIELDLSHAYESVHIPFTINGVAATIAQMAAGFEYIRLVIDGKPQCSWTGAEWHKRCSTWDSVNWAPRVGFFDFYFGLPEAFSQAAQLDTVLGTVGFRKIHLEIVLAAGLVVPAFGTAKAWKWAQDIRSTFIIRNLRSSENPSAGNHYINDLSTQDGDILAIHHTTTDVEAMTVEVNDGKIIDELSRDENGVVMSRRGNFAQDAAWTTLMFPNSGMFSDRLGMIVDSNPIRKLKYIPRMTAGVAHDLITEVYGRPIGR